MENANDLIVVRQIPILEERMHAVKQEVDRRVFDSSALVCTESTVKAIKSDRAENRRLLEYIKKRLRSVEETLLEPFTPIKEYCQKELIAPLERLDAQQKKDISEVEDGIIKKRCEEGLREYFAELCAAHHLEWLTYDRAGIKVDMASARAGTPKKLREQLTSFVVGVSDSVNRISTMDDAEEIMVEFRRTLNAADAICTVQERHRRIEEERAAREERKSVLDKEAEVVRKVEALAPPVQIEPPKILKCTFTVRTTMDKLKKLKEFLNMEGIQYE